MATKKNKNHNSSKKPSAAKKKQAVKKPAQTKKQPQSKTTVRMKRVDTPYGQLLQNIKENTALSIQTVRGNRIYQKVSGKFHEHRRSSPHRSFRITRKSEIRYYETIPATWWLMVRTVKLLKREWKKALPLVAIFAPLAWIVTGIFSEQFAALKDSLTLFEGTLNLSEELVALGTGFVVSQGTIPQDALILLNILGLIAWLSFVWIARYSYAGKPTSMREALYTSPSAFVPFLLLVILLVIQLIPIMLAAVIFFSLQGGGFTQTTLERALFIVLGALLLVFSFYFIVSTLMALQVATLPGMYPWRALRNARKLVTNRRFAVLRKVVMLPIVIIIFFAVTVIPLLYFDKLICAEGSCWSTATILPLGYYIVVGISIAFASTYLYVIYRALLEQEDDYI